MDRDQKIVQTSVIGIVLNAVLVIFKMIVGIVTGSIAIILDAVNNLSDALSSVITIVGTKLANRPPDRKHPYGYGRIEYLTSMLIAMLVLVAGCTSIKESVVKVIHPEEASYTIASLIIVAAAVLVKLGMGTYVKKVGKEINSQALIASGSDALFDSILSVATLIAAIVSMTLHFSLEGILGAVISAIIIKAGFEMLMETFSSIIGERADRELTNELKAKIRSYEGVRGAYDVTLHNYGPTQTMGTVHIEVEDSMNAKQIHALTRKIAMEIYKEMGIILTIGIYASNQSDEKILAFKKSVEEVVHQHPSVLQLHAFYVDKPLVMFDMVCDFSEDPTKTRSLILDELHEKFPEYHFEIAIDISYSD